MNFASSFTIKFVSAAQKETLTESKGLTRPRRQQNMDESVLIPPKKLQTQITKNFPSTPSIARQSNPRQAWVTPKS